MICVVIGALWVKCRVHLFCSRLICSRLILVSWLDYFTAHFIKRTIKGQITTKVVCFCHLLNCFKSLFDKQCRLRSGCSYHDFLSILVIKKSDIENLFYCMDYLEKRNKIRGHRTNYLLGGPKFNSTQQISRIIQKVKE